MCVCSRVWRWIVSKPVCYLVLYVQKTTSTPHPVEQRVVTIQPADDEDGERLADNVY